MAPERFSLGLSARQILYATLSQGGQLISPWRAEMARSYAAGVKFRLAARAWAQDEKQFHVLKRLREVLRHAQRHTPYYRHLFTSVGFDAEIDFDFSDFARLPVLEREQATRYERDLIARDIPESRLIRDSTGGSSGKPVRVWLGPHELGWKDSAADFYRRQIGVVRGRKTALFWGHNLDPVACDTFRQRAAAYILNRRWFDCFRLSPEILERYHNEMQSWRPEYIVAYAGALAALASYVLERGYHPSYPSACCITGAEKLYPKQRDLIQRAFGKVHEQYGARDTGLIAFQVNQNDNTLEIDWPNLLVEPETSEPESSILVTKLNADGTIMIRYRLGDIARFSEGSRPGHPAFYLDEVLGRSSDRIYLPTGHWISGLQFPHLMKGHPVQEFLLLQRPDYSVDLQIVPQAQFSIADRETIRSTIAANLPGLEIHISLVARVERMQANKLRPVVSQVHVPTELGS